MARLVLSPRAEADLEEIGDYIARDNPARALAFLDELRDTARRSSMRRDCTCYAKNSAPASE